MSLQHAPASDYAIGTRQYVHHLLRKLQMYGYQPPTDFESSDMWEKWVDNFDFVALARCVKEWNEGVNSNMHKVQGMHDAIYKAEVECKDFTVEDWKANNGAFRHVLNLYKLCIVYSATTYIDLPVGAKVDEWWEDCEGRWWDKPALWQEAVNQLVFDDLEEWENSLLN